MRRLTVPMGRVFSPFVEYFHVAGVDIADAYGLCDYGFIISQGNQFYVSRFESLGYDLTDETEQASARKVALCLLNTGYEFASFTYDGIGYGEASEEEVAQDVKQWKETLEPVLGPVSILFYANGSDLASYEGAKFQTLYEGGFRYFCALDSSVPSWVQIENTYVRQARRTINGTRITEEAGQVADLFDATKIISPDRPE